MSTNSEWAYKSIHAILGGLRCCCRRSQLSNLFSSAQDKNIGQGVEESVSFPCVTVGVGHAAVFNCCYFLLQEDLLWPSGVCLILGQTAQQSSMRSASESIS